jgi:hypothetical protein
MLACHTHSELLIRCGMRMCSAPRWFDNVEQGRASCLRWRCIRWLACQSTAEARFRDGTQHHVRDLYERFARNRVLSKYARYSQTHCTWNICTQSVGMTLALYCATAAPTLQVQDDTIVSTSLQGDATSGIAVDSNVKRIVVFYKWYAQSALPRYRVRSVSPVSDTTQQPAWKNENHHQPQAVAVPTCGAVVDQAMWPEYVDSTCRIASECLHDVDL